MRIVDYGIVRIIATYCPRTLIMSRQIQPPNTFGCCSSVRRDTEGGLDGYPFGNSMCPWNGMPAQGPSGATIVKVHAKRSSPMGRASILVIGLLQSSLWSRCSRLIADMVYIEGWMSLLAIVVNCTKPKTTCVSNQVQQLQGTPLRMPLANEGSRCR
jgi:hypothetical protein